MYDDIDHFNRILANLLLYSILRLRDIPVAKLHINNRLLGPAIPHALFPDKHSDVRLS